MILKCNSRVTEQTIYNLSLNNKLIHQINMGEYN